MVHLLAVFPKAETNVRACSQPRTAYITDGLSLLYMYAPANSFCKTFHMKVLGRISAVVFDFYKISVAFSISSFHDYAVAHCKYRRTCRSRIIGAEMRAHSFQNRMKAAQIITRRNTCIFHGRFEESFVHRAAFQVVISFVFFVVKPY